MKTQGGGGGVIQEDYNPPRAEPGTGTSRNCGCLFKGRPIGDEGLLMERPRHVISKLLIHFNFPGPSFLPSHSPRDTQPCLSKAMVKSMFELERYYRFQALSTQYSESSELQNIKQTGWCIQIFVVVIKSA